MGGREESGVVPESRKSVYFVLPAAPEIPAMFRRPCVVNRRFLPQQNQPAEFRRDATL
jgi:hypothetical protein